MPKYHFGDSRSKVFGKRTLQFRESEDRSDGQPPKLWEPLTFSPRDSGPSPKPSLPVPFLTDSQSVMSSRRKMNTLIQRKSNASSLMGNSQLGSSSSTSGAPTTQLNVQMPVEVSLEPPSVVSSLGSSSATSAFKPVIPGTKTPSPLLTTVLKTKEPTTSDELPPMEEPTSVFEKPVHWDDAIRGILIALIRERKEIWDSRLPGYHDNATKRKCFREISSVLQNHNKDFTEGIVTEKWRYMRHLYIKAYRIAKAAAPGQKAEIAWRFYNCLDFLRTLEECEIMKPQMSEQYFTELCQLFGDTEEWNLVEKANRLAHSDSVKGNPESANGTETAAVVLSTVSHETISGNVENAKGRGRHTRGSGKVPAMAASQPINGVANEVGGPQAKKPKLEETSIQDIVDSLLGPKNDKLEWTNDLLEALIEAVKKRPAIWDSAHPESRSINKRKDNFAEIATELSRTKNIALTEEAASEKWTSLRESFNRLLKKMKNNNDATKDTPLGAFYHLMSFLNKKSKRAELPSGSSFDSPSTPMLLLAPPVVTTTVTIAPTDILTNTGPTTLVVDEATAALIQGAVGSGRSLPKGLEEILLRTLTANGMPNMAEAVNGSAPQTSASTVKPEPEELPATSSSTALVSSPTMLSSSSTAEEQKPVIVDRWTTFGKMVEESCREMETRNAQLAIRLQKAINDIIFDFQMKALSSHPSS